MDHGQIREHGHHPEDCSHSVEQAAQDQQHDPLGPFKESDLARRDQVFGPRPAVAHQDGADHHDGGQHDVAEPFDPRVVDEEARQENEVRVPVHDRIQKGSEPGDLVGVAGHRSIRQVEDRSAQNHQTGVEELPAGQNPRRRSVDNQADQRQGVRMHAAQGQQANQPGQDHAAALANCFGQRHARFRSPAPPYLLWMVCMLRISNSLRPLGVTASTMSPARLPSSERPIGEVVEILPAATSDSSEVTNS